MRNMRSALWALGLAGAAYAWRNRDRLQQQLNSGRGQPAPRLLPDNNYEPENAFPEQDGTQGELRDRPLSGGAQV